MPDYTIAVLDKAIRVLQVMSEAQRPVALTEIVRTVEESKNAVFRILKTFEKHGFVVQLETRWALGTALHVLVDTDIRNKLSRWSRAYEREARRNENAKHNRTGENGRAARPKETTIS